MLLNPLPDLPRLLRVGLELRLFRPELPKCEAKPCRVGEVSREPAREPARELAAELKAELPREPGSRLLSVVVRFQCSSSGCELRSDDGGVGEEGLEFEGDSSE